MKFVDLLKSGGGSVISLYSSVLKIWKCRCFIGAIFGVNRLKVVFFSENLHINVSSQTAASYIIVNSEFEAISFVEIIRLFDFDRSISLFS